MSLKNIGIAYLLFSAFAIETAAGAVLAERPQGLYLQECDPDSSRRTIVLIDRDALSDSSRSMTDVVLGVDGKKGILGSDFLAPGERFHILVFRSSAPAPLFDYYFQGCSIGKTSRSAPLGRDAEDLARDRKIDQTTRLRRALKVLTNKSTAAGVGDDANPVGMIKLATDQLVRGDLSTRMVIFGGLAIKEAGEIPEGIREGVISGYPKMNLTKTKVHVVGVSPTVLGGTGAFRDFQMFWRKLIAESGGWLASFDMRFEDGSRISESLPIGLGAVFTATGRAGPHKGIMATSAAARLDMRLRNDRLKPDVDWLTLNDGTVDFSFPMSGIMSCAGTGCRYQGKILRDHPHESGPKAGDPVRLSIDSKGAFGAIDYKARPDKVKFQIVVAR